MKLVMAVSRDGYLSRGKNDRMDWLGPTDKAVFRILTGVGGHCAVGSKSAECMPKTLQGRELTVLSRHGTTLRQFASANPDGWLLGGPTLALKALEGGLLSEVHLCRSDRRAFPDPMTAGAINDCVTRFLEAHDPWWSLDLVTPIGDLKVERWKRYGKHVIQDS